MLRLHVISSPGPPGSRGDLLVRLVEKTNLCAIHTKHVPFTVLEVAKDYIKCDSELAEFPAITSLQNTEPLPSRQEQPSRNIPWKYESVVYELTRQLMEFDVKEDKVLVETTTVPTNKNPPEIANHFTVNPSPKSETNTNREGSP